MMDAANKAQVIENGFMLHPATGHMPKPYAGVPNRGAWLLLAVAGEVRGAFATPAIA